MWAQKVCGMAEIEEAYYDNRRMVSKVRRQPSETVISDIHDGNHNVMREKSITFIGSFFNNIILENVWRFSKNLEISKRRRPEATHCHQNPISVCRFIIMLYILLFQSYQKTISIPMGQLGTSSSKSMSVNTVIESVWNVSAQLKRSWLKFFAFCNNYYNTDGTYAFTWYFIIIEK